jgi:bacteriocin biosynthesis cyclodehydratase domain-containing protein
MMMMYKKNENWNMIMEEKRLFVTQGADEVYYLDEISTEQAPVLYDAYQENTLHTLADKPDFIQIVKKLERAGVIYQNKFAAKNENLKIALDFRGKTDVREYFEGVLSLQGRAIDIVEENPDLLLIFRMNTTLLDVLESYETVTVPHLFIDLAYAHTVSIGPLVFSGETACLRCVVGRLTKNWGDMMPPPQPAVMEHRELIAALLLEKLREYRVMGNCPDLVNAIWSFNVKKFTCQYDTILKLPWCPQCGAIPENSKFDLPWGNDFGK